MEAADVLEVYARIKGVAEVPVVLHREPERRDDGARVDVDRWIGSECATDTECDFEGGFCKPNPYSGRGWCTVECDRYCPDEEGRPTTLCVADPAGGEGGVCVNRLTKQNADCRDLDHFVPVATRRFGRAFVSDACVPGSRGFTGDGCLADDDCLGGLRCAAAVEGERGQCTESCARFCSDMPGYAGTFCVEDESFGEGGHCARTCDPDHNAPECGEGLRCVSRARIGQPGRVEHVCLAD